MFFSLLDVLENLILWALEGIDMSKAMAQPETAYKVRHIKMGVRLVSALCTTDSNILNKMLSLGIQDKLLDLYMIPHMAPSVQLMIIRVCIIVNI